MSGWIFVDKDNEGDTRSNMRRAMRGGYRRYGASPMMRDGNSWEQGYRQGYKHGYEDSEEDMNDDMEYRRARDSRGRYV